MSNTLRWGFAILLIILFLVGGAVGMAGFKFWLFLRSPGPSGSAIRHVQIAPGTKAAAVARLLAAEGIVADGDQFHILSRLRKVDQKIKAGEYALLSLSTPGQILDQIVSGRAIIERVTFPEGITVYEVARILKDRGLASDEEVLRLAADRGFIESIGLQGASLEGFLFPDTYFFQRTQGGVAILKMMISQFRRNLPENWEQRAAELGLGLRELVIMASMVEKEAAVDSERPVIAGVFYNRLKAGMPLQSDPTAVYDLADFSGRITGTQLKRRSPYNTYQKRGLPIGPICSPGARSLRAAFFPEDVPYLYFVSRGDGTHQFSQTLTEHNHAVSRFQKKPRGSTAGAAGDQSPYSPNGG